MRCLHAGVCASFVRSCTLEALQEALVTQTPRQRRSGSSTGDTNSSQHQQKLWCGLVGAYLLAGPVGPLTAEPEITAHELTHTDEFLLLGCDGLWDVFPSQRAVEFARGRLREHNDPQRCVAKCCYDGICGVL